MPLSDTATHLTERLEPAQRRARQVIESKADDLSGTVGPVARAVGASLAVLPAVISRLLALAAALLELLSDRGRQVAERVEERGRELAAGIDPPARIRRRRALRTAGWFLGGFAAGAATGYVVARREPRGLYGPDIFGDELRHDEMSLDGSGTADDEPAEPLIDARTEDASLS